MGNGDGIDLTSMERTFSQIVITEGKKQGYLSALEVIEELRRHKVIDPEAEIDMPDVETILKP